MAESSRPSAPIRTVINGVHYEISDIVGHPISYLKEFVASGGVSVPEDTDTCVFTMDEPVADAPSVLGRKNAILAQSENEKSVAQILQGVMLKVSDDYVLSPSDLLIEFRPR